MQRDIPRILEALVSFLIAVEEYREEVRGVYVALTGQDTGAGAGSSEGEAAGEGVQQDISPEKERTRVEVVKATEIIDTLEDGASLRYLIRHTQGMLMRAFLFGSRSSKSWYIRHRTDVRG